MTSPLLDMFLTILISVLAGMFTMWMLLEFCPKKKRTADCCEQDVFDARSYTNLSDGDTLICRFCYVHWRFTRGRASWWERIDTNERRAVELHEGEITDVR